MVREAPVTGTFVASMEDEAAAQLRRERPDVLIMRDRPIDLIRPNRVASVNGPDPWHLDAIGLLAAREAGAVGSGAGVTIAVLDTGVDATHPELLGKVAGAVTFDSRLRFWDVIPQNPSSDTEGHGTHVAGLIGGNTVGVAPAASLLSGVMIPRGSGTISDFVLALEWALSRPEVQIVNMSAGIAGYVAQEAFLSIVSDIRLAGVLSIFAIGNEGRNRTRSPGNYVEPLSVGATNRQGRVAGFSGSGTIVSGGHQYTVPDLVAPGVQVSSSVVGGGFEAWDGTSMATPIVSGVAALLVEKKPDLPVDELEEILLSSCVDLGLPVVRQGQGLIQVGTPAWN
jgi:subtilisin family serine protease